jgi:hypothetical protein
VTTLTFDLGSAGQWATIVGAPLTAASVIVAAAAIIWQSRQAQFTATLDSLWHFDDELHGNTMRRIRLAAATALMAGKDVPEIVDVLNYFEMLGLVFRKKGIDPEVTLENFGAWVIGYWYACQDRIAKDRTGDPSNPGDQGDPSAWEEFEGMKTALEQLDLKKKRAAARGSVFAAPSPPNVTAFLDDECNLTV